ncbi:hypothetical protein Taro_046729, partial [Colocasia esculenta]|nr:hypothetical protein [Colocasia esculenta]
PSVVVQRLFKNASLVGYPMFCVSQARVFVVLGVCPDAVCTIEVCVIFVDTLTPVFELYIRLRETRQRAATCVCVVACSVLVVGGTDTSRRTGLQLVLFSSASLYRAQAGVPKGSRHGPAAVWSTGVLLVGLHCSWLYCVVVERQLDLSSVTVVACVCDSLVEVLLIVVCPGSGTVLVVVSWWYLVEVGLWSDLPRVVFILVFGFPVKFVASGTSGCHN